MEGLNQFHGAYLVRNNCMFILRHISDVCHIHGFIVILFLSMKCDLIAATDTTGCISFFVALCSYIGENAYCHLVGVDDEKIMSS